MLLNKSPNACRYTLFAGEGVRCPWNIPRRLLSFSGQCWNGTEGSGYQKCRAQHQDACCPMLLYRYGNAVRTSGANIIWSTKLPKVLVRWYFWVKVDEKRGQCFPSKTCLNHNCNVSGKPWERLDQSEFWIPISVYHTLRAFVKFTKCQLWIMVCTVERCRLPGECVFVVFTEVCAFMTRYVFLGDEGRWCLHWEFPRTVTVNFSLSASWAKLARHDIPDFDFVVCMLLSFQTLVSPVYFVGKIGANWKTSQKNWIRGTLLM